MLVIVNSPPALRFIEPASETFAESHGDDEDSAGT